MGARVCDAAFGQEGKLADGLFAFVSGAHSDKFHVTILDENVTELDFGKIAKAHLVGLTGMSVQRERMKEILGQLKARGVFTS